MGLEGVESQNWAPHDLSHSLILNNLWFAQESSLQVGGFEGKGKVVQDSACRGREYQKGGGDSLQLHTQEYQ